MRAIGNVGQLLLQLVGTWAATINSGDYRSADALKELIELAEREGTHMNLALAHMSRIETHFYLGRLAEAESHFMRGRAFFDEEAFKQIPGALGTALGFASLTAFMTGRIDTARTRISEVARAAHDRKNPYYLAYVSFQTGALEVLIEESTEAVRAAREAISLSDEHGFPHIAAAARATLGAAWANCGEAAQGVQLIDESLKAFAATETRTGATLSLSYLAQAQSLQGATDKALHTIERALEATPDEVVYRPEVLRLRGELRLRAGDRERAAEDFRQAITCAHGIGAKSFELRTTTSLARLLRDANRRDEARAMLAEIYNWFTEGFDLPDMKDAKALLDELSN